MSARISQLESLLARVQARAAEPRLVATAAPIAEEPEMDSSDLELDEPAAAKAPALLAAEPEPADELGFDDADELSLDEPDDFSLDAAAEPEADELSMDEPEELSMDEPEELSLSASEPEPLSLSSADATELDEPSFDDLDEDAPVSHSGLRSDASELSLDEVDEELAPITPPPESGESLSDLRGAGQERGAADSLAPPASFPAPESQGPTMEQLGETISLEEGPNADFELDDPASVEAPMQEADAEQLEPDEHELAEDFGAESTHAAAGGGNFDAGLSSPPTAQADLNRVVLGETQEIAASVSERPVLSTNVVEFIEAGKSFAPKSFAELLDESLTL